VTKKIGAPASPGPSPLEVCRFAGQWWLCILVGFLIPLDFLYRAASLWEAMPAVQIGVSLASLIVFGAAAAAGAALASLAAALILRPLASRGPALVLAVNAVGGVLLLLIVILSYLWKWVIHFLKMPWTMTIDPALAWCCPLLALVITAIWIIKIKLNPFIGKLRSFSSAAFRANLIVVGLCGLVAAAVIGTNLYQRHQAGRRPAEAGGSVSKPNIILITFDALSARHTTLHGYSRNTTPNLQALARDSYVFEHAYASCNFTGPTLASLLTGKYPSNHRILNHYSFFLGRSTGENLAVILRRHGYQTLAATASQFAVPYHRNLAGFDRVSRCFSNSRALALISEYYYKSGLGSAAWLVTWMRENPLAVAAKELVSRWRWASPPGTATGERSLGVYAPETTLREAAALIQTAGAPFFLWIHILPPHDPFVPQKPFLYTFLPEKVFDGPQVLTRDLAPDNAYPPQDQPKVDQLAARYDEHILYADHEVGKFLAQLRQSGVLDQSIVMLTADHGEMFSRGFLSHCGPYTKLPSKE
jgi:hypothetical protein